MVGRKDMMKLAWWGKFLLLLVLNLILVGPVGAKIAPDEEPGPVTDYGQFLGELQAAGALRFYDNTEELLRLAQFERALMRYRFLKGQVQRRADYRHLVRMIDLRLHFLQKQLHLRDSEVAAIPPRKVKAVRKPPEVKPPPEKPAAAKPKTYGEGEEGPSISGAPGPPAKAAIAPLPGAQKPPDVVTSTPKARGDEKAEEEKDAAESKPALPPNFWQKLKIRLNLGKKKE